MTDTITLPRAVLKQALEALGDNEWGTAHHDDSVSAAIRAALEQPEAVTACHQMPRRLTREQWEAIAHRTASRYSHRSDPHYIAYTFLPHTLEDFVTKLQDVIEGQP